MEGAVDKLALSGGDVEVALRRPVSARRRLYVQPLRRSRGRQAGWHRRFRARPRQKPGRRSRSSDVADAAAADVGMQHLHPAGGEFIGENAARVAHSGCEFGWFSNPGAAATSITRSGCRLSAKQGGDRQHRTGFLNIEQPAEMFGGTAQRQRVVILSLESRIPLRTRAPARAASRRGDRRGNHRR